MGYSLDYIAGIMKCAKCGTVSNADTPTDMQVKICIEPELKDYGVGGTLELDITRIRDNYYCIVEPIDQSSFSMINIWACPNCHVYNSAIVVVKDSVVESVNEILMDDENVKQVNYITNLCDFIGWKYVNGEMIRF